LWPTEETIFGFGCVTHLYRSKKVSTFILRVLKAPLGVWGSSLRRNPFIFYNSIQALGAKIKLNLKITIKIVETHKVISND
jgi:hypothetical protein